MPVFVIDLVFFVFVLAVGLAVGWWLRGGEGRRLHRHAADFPKGGHKDAQEDDAERARDVLARLHELAARVAHDVGEHNCRVQEINEELTSRDQDADVVVDAVSRLISANAQMQQQLLTAQQRLEEQARQIESRTAEALTDVLTHLANRRRFDEELQRRAAEWQRYGRPVSMVLIDVDHFKKFNDTHGHLAGDEVLRGVARVLQQTVREIDLPARYGGEEFAVVLPDTDIEAAATAADRMRLAIEQAVFSFGGVDLQVTASLGTAQLAAGETGEALVRRADEALYTSKGAGRNCTHWHDGRTSRPYRSAAADRPESPPPAAETPQSAAPVALPAESPKDFFSQLSSRTAFFQDVKRHLAEVRRNGESISVLLVEVDDIPKLIARLGEPAGQTALRATAQFLLASMREMDHLARYDTETFALLLPTADLHQAAQIAERLRFAVSRAALPMRGGSLSFTISLGVAEAATLEPAESFLHRAELALSEAASRGGNKVYLHDGELCLHVQAPEETLEPAP